MMHLIKNKRRKKVKIGLGEMIEISPEYILEVKSLKKNFPIRTFNKYFLCDYEMNFTEVFSLETSFIPDNLIIDFEYDKRTADIFNLITIIKEEDLIKCVYRVDIDLVHQVKTFKWAFPVYYNAFKREIVPLKEIATKVYNEDSLDFSVELTISTPLLKKIAHCITFANSKLIHIHKNVQIVLGNIQWKKMYEKNEKKFSIEILEPLFRKMGLQSIVFNHGKNEFGKDFTFSELDKFGQIRNCGVQVKAGNISGEVNSKIDEIIGQIQDAFQIPFYNINSNNPQYISTILIIISGQFTENAKEKILQKLSKGLYGVVYFMDKRNILELIEKYWTI